MVNHQSAWTVSSPVEHMPRRRFLRATSLLFTSTAIGLILDARLSRVLAAQQVQDDWAHCGDCNMLFFNGFHTDKGRCPAFGVPAKSGHIAEKLASLPKKYQVVFDDSVGTAHNQWRFCHKCGVLFLAEAASMGVCSADHGGHEAAGHIFLLSHDRPPGTDEEGNWRLCEKCHALFFAGAANSSRSGCPVDGKGHQANAHPVVVRQAREHFKL